MKFLKHIYADETPKELPYCMYCRRLLMLQKKILPASRGIYDFRVFVTAFSEKKITRKNKHPLHHNDINGNMQTSDQENRKQEQKKVAL